MDWIDATSVLAILACAAVAVWFIWRRKKENNPQDYTNKHILVIELWIISIFIITVMQKVTILIAW